MRAATGRRRWPLVGQVGSGSTECYPHEPLRTINAATDEECNGEQRTSVAAGNNSNENDGGR